MNDLAKRSEVEESAITDIASVLASADLTQKERLDLIQELIAKAEAKGESERLFTPQPPLPGAVTEYERTQARHDVLRDPALKEYAELSKKDPSYQPILAFRNIRTAIRLGYAKDHARAGNTELDRQLTGAPEFEQHQLESMESIKNPAVPASAWHTAKDHEDAVQGVLHALSRLSPEDREALKKSL